MTAHVCHDLIGQHVEIVDVKDKASLPHVGRTGEIKHDPTFGHDYLSFDDGGSIDPALVIVESTADLIRQWRADRDQSGAAGAHDATTTDEAKN